MPFPMPSALRRPPSWVTLFAGVSVAFFSARSAPRVVINEIHYHPASENDAEEFVELYNAGDAPQDLSGWTLKGGVDFSFGAHILPAGGFLTVAANLSTFAALHPGAAPVTGPLSGVLGNSGNNLRLLDEL